MIARRFSAQSVLGITILLSCAGGSSGEGNGGGGSEAFPPFDPNGGADPPSSGFDVPPSDYDEPGGGEVPPPGYDHPSADDVPGGTCAKLCQAVLAHACDDAQEDAATCEPDCNESLKELGPCVNQAIALIECVVRSQYFTCEVLGGEPSQGDYRECTFQAYDYINCLDLNDGTGGTGGTGGTAGEGGAPEPTGGTGPGAMGGMAGGGTAGGGTGGT
jgi:hypothetical protein